MGRQQVSTVLEASFGFDPGAAPALACAPAANRALRSVRPVERHVDGAPEIRRPWCDCAPIPFDANETPAISVVVPLLNEGATVHALARRISATLGSGHNSFEILLVDDGSTPAEKRILQDVATCFERVRVIELAEHSGQLMALVCGLAHTRGDFVVTMDGDLQDRPEEIPTLLAGLGQGVLGRDVQVVTARRDVLHGAHWRRWGSRGITTFAGSLVGRRLSDFGGQFNVYRRDAVDAMLAVWRPRTPLLPLACALQLRVDEVSVRCRPRAFGRSRHGLAMKLGIVADLVANLAPRRLTATLAATTVAAVVAAISLLVGIVRHEPISAGDVVLLVGVAVILGFVLAGAGLITGSCLARRRCLPAHTFGLGVALAPANGSAELAATGPSLFSAGAAGNEFVTAAGSIK